MRGQLQRVDRKFNVDVALQLSVAAGIDEFLHRLRNHAVAVVVQPIDQRADRDIVAVFGDRGVIKCTNKLAAIFECSQQKLEIDLDAERFQFSYLVPKFHLPAHGESCQTSYSFNYTKGVGRTHGETVEQGWANINLAALSTREMGPGARHLALDDNWSGWNWKKILGMGNVLFILC